MKTETDVLIIGAGPTGLALSIALLQEGVDHMLIDRLDHGQNTSRAGVIHAQTLDTLESLGVAEELSASGLKIKHFTIRDRDRRLIELDFSELPTPHAYMLMLPQNETERILARRIERLGGVIHRGCTAKRIAQNETGAAILVSCPDGERTVRARYVVGGDGMKSIVRASTSIGFDGDTYAEAFVLADVHMDWPFARSEVSLFLSPAGMVVVAPLPDGSFRVVATYENAPEDLSVRHIQKLLDERGPAVSKATVRDIVWSSHFRVHHRLAKAYREGRLILMGDAAHLHSPAGGQGMNTGLIDAVVLGQVLTSVVRKQEPVESLNIYEDLRRPAAQEVLSLAGRLTTMATSQGRIKRWLRDAVLTFINVNPLSRKKLEMGLSGLSRADRARLPNDRRAAA